jgi:hypothetical protein
LVTTGDDGLTLATSIERLLAKPTCAHSPATILRVIIVVALGDENVLGLQECHCKVMD